MKSNANNTVSKLSWNRKRTGAELTSFIEEKLAELENVSLED